MMRFEVIKGFNEVRTKHIPLSDGTKKEVFNQDMWMHKGGPFPVQITVSVDSVLAAYPVGNYQLDPNSFTTNKYGGLELDRYATKFVQAQV